MVTIVQSTAVRTSPAPHSQACDTFWAASCAARRTGCGSVSLIDSLNQCAMADAFVVEHVAECAPASIEDGLGHRRLRQVERVHIADCDIGVVAHERGRLLVQEMPSGVRDFCMDRPRVPLVASALGASERLFVNPKQAWRWDRLPVAQHCERFKSQVDADWRPITTVSFRNCALKVDIPSASCVATKVASPKFTIDFTRAPKKESALQVGHVRPANPDRARGKWYPAKRLFGRTKTRATADRVSPRNELAAYSLHRVRMQAQFSAGPGTKVDQVERRGPLPSPSNGVALHFAAVVPNEGRGASMASEMLAGGGVFDSKLERYNHVREDSSFTHYSQVVAVQNGQSWETQ